MQGLQDQHPKVRWAACQAVGQMCTDLGPDFQEAEHTRLLPGLMAVMDDFNHPRIQAHAAAAVVNFSENCEQVQHTASHPAQCTMIHILSDTEDMYGSQIVGNLFKVCNMASWQSMHDVARA